MANFLIDKSRINGQRAELDAELSRHMRTVLRMGEGDSFTLCDGEGMFYDAELSPDGSAKIKRAYPAPTEPRLKITLFQALPKNPKLEFIIQKAAEIGIVRVVPMNTERIVARLEKDSKLERLRKIAREASAQSRRGIVPEVTAPVSFERAAELASQADIAVIPYEDEHKTPFKDCLRGKTAESLSILIGPEGGFSAAEVETAKQKGIVPATLGPRILRTETAGLVAAAIALYELGDME